MLNWESNMEWARKALNPNYRAGSERRTWTWGNYKPGSELEKDVESGSKQYHLFADPQLRFVLMDRTQNLACGNKCKGWE